MDGSPAARRQGEARAAPVRGVAIRWVALAATPGLLLGPCGVRVRALSLALAVLAWLLLACLALRLRRGSGRAADGALLVLFFLVGAGVRAGQPAPAPVPPDLPALVIRGRCVEGDLGLIGHELEVAWEGRWRPLSGRFLLRGAPRCTGRFVLRGMLADLEDPPSLGLVDREHPARTARIRGKIDASAFWLEPGPRGKTDPGWRARLRTRLRARLSPRLPPLEACLLEKILWNDETPLPPEIARVFRATGTVHLLAISGLHVSFLAFLIEFLLRLFVRCAPLRLALALTGLLGYAVFIGPLPSVVRSTVMAVCLLAGRGFGRRASAESSLWVAWLAMAAASPGALVTAGARLSFAATAALLWRPRWGRRLEPLSASVAPTLATLGILWAHFGEASPSAVIANLVAVPAFAPVFVSYLWGLAWGPGGSTWLASLAWEPARLLTACWMAPLEHMAPLGEATILRASCGETIGLISSGCVLCLLALARAPGGRHVAIRRGALWLLALATMVVAALAPARIRGRSTGDLEVSVLSVGQGDAVLLRGRGGAVLVDTGPGGRDRMGGARVVAPALRFLGVERLRAVFLTHGDEDHIGGMRGLLLAGLDVDTIYVSRADETLLTLPRSSAPPVRALSSPWRRSMGSFDIELLAPCVERQERRGNEGSMVLLVRAGDRSLLLPGDLGRRGESELLRSGKLPRVDVVMAGHHGSETSSSEPFCDRLKPRMVVISCGVRNHHGHPSPQTLARFGHRGIPVHRTDREGTLFLRSRAGQLLFRSRGCRGWVAVL